MDQSSEMLQQVGNFRDEMRSQAKKTEELPAGAAPVEAKEEAPEAPPAPVAEAAPEEVTPPAPKEEPETLIRIGDQTFKTQAEAIRYAEKLEQEKLFAEAHRQGIQEAIQALTPQVPVAPQEDNFEEEFYTKPKETLLKVKEQAKAEIRAEQQAEERKRELWKTFEDRYPDIDRRDAEIILAQNADSIGKLTDIDKGLELLARKTRSEYQRIVERYKPRTELPPSRGTSTIPSNSGSRSVTPEKKEEPVLTMAEQMKTLRGQKRNLPA